MIEEGTIMSIVRNEAEKMLQISAYKKVYKKLKLT